jgi:predicted MFS family arabinose efflux permease
MAPGPDVRAKISLFSLVSENQALALTWIGQTVSKVGNGVNLVVLGWTVYQLTGSPAIMGLVMAANALPQLIFALYGGVLADRFSRRKVVLVADSASGVTTCALAIGAVLSMLTGGWLILAAAILGGAGAIYGPAYRSIVSDLVEPENYGRANGLLQASASTAQIVGPGIAGGIFAFGGAAAGFGFDTATFAIAVGCMMFTRLPMATVRYAGTVWNGVSEGLGFACRQRWMRSALALALSLNAFAMAPFVILLPSIVKSIHESSALLSSAVAVELGAAAIVSVLLGRVQSDGAYRSLGLLAAVLGAGVLILGVSTSALTVLLATALVGIGLGFEVVESTLILSRTPADLVSRVFSVDIMLSFAVLPLAYVTVGVLARAAYGRTVLTAGGAVVVAIGLTATFLARISQDQSVLTDGPSR